MRYIIVGAGAVGATIGARLADVGHSVVLVARGAHYVALRDEGLRFATPTGSSLLRLPVADGPNAVSLLPGDVIVMAVKSQDTASVLAAWAGQPVSGGGTAATRVPIVCAQNGVDNERAALRVFRQVYGMSVWLPAAHLEPGSVAASGGPLSGMLHVGRYPSGVDDIVTHVGADLSGAQFLAPVVPDVMRWKYAKLLDNAGNALEALTGRIVSDEQISLARRAAAEGAAVLDAAGIEYASRAEQAERRGDLVQHLPVDGQRRGGGSSWQSLERRTGSIEADYLNGEIVLLGRLHGVPTPVNEVLQRLANDFARSGRPAGSLPVEELTAQIDATTSATVASVDPFARLLQLHSAEVRDLAEKARALVHKVVPDAAEEFDESAEMLAFTYQPGTYTGLIAAIVPQKRYVNIMLSKGAELVEMDESGLLEGTGKVARHIKVRSADRLDDPAVRTLIAEAAARTRH